MTTIRSIYLSYINYLQVAKSGGFSQIYKFRIDNGKATFACHDHREVIAMGSGSGFDANTVLEILRTAGSVGLSTSVAIVLALQSPKLLQVTLTFIRNIIKDFRTPPQPPTSRARQSEKPLLEK